MALQAPKIGSGDQPQVFVSYARHDAEQVQSIARLLEQEGATVWRDEERILGGQYYGEQIVHAIAHSRVVMLMCSPQAFQSDNVHREVLLTWDHYHRHYIPVWLCPATEIPERFRYCLTGCQWIDAHSQPPERWLPQLLKAFEALGVETKNPGTHPGKGTPGSGDESDRRGFRFRPGDKPIRGADWELERLLGKGGFGEVWKANNPHLPGVPSVALKFCLELDDRGKGLLRHEADMVLRAQQQIQSDGIVPLLHAYLSNDPPCLEYPYIEGGTLVRLLDKCRESAGSFTPAQVQSIIERIAETVGQAHRLSPKLVHRDLKPSNILVQRGENGKFVLRVTDFGIGGLAAQPVLERSRSSSSLVGNMASVLTGAYSPLYASPQQVGGDKPDPRDDVYALGVIWYQLLSGDLTRPPPTGRRWVDDLRNRGMSDAAVNLLSSCFESAPADRPDDAGTLFEMLQTLPSSTPVKPARLTSQSPTRPTARLRGWVAAGVLGMAALLGVIVYVTTDRGTVKIMGTDPKMKVLVDGQEVRIENLGKPITVRTGSHKLLVTRDELEVKTDTFLIRRGKETVLEVTYTPAGPKVVRTVPDPNPEAGTVSPKPATERTNTPATKTPIATDTESITTRAGQIKLARIPTSTFLMGAFNDEADSEAYPRHEVQITRSFYLGVFEVTQGQYAAIMGQNPSYFATTGDGKNRVTGHPTEQSPVENVSWFDAVSFCNTLSEKEGMKPYFTVNGSTVTVPDRHGAGFRLPTEAEWEFACRAGSTTRYSFGDDPAELGDHAWYVGNSKINGDHGPHPVGQKQRNAFGLFDMHGNIWEWCWDWHRKGYDITPTSIDPLGPATGVARVLRGGCFYYDPGTLRSASRVGRRPETRSRRNGFRLARNAN
jgi:formylglycine-generating enzyme required for sulfatase activity/serine/threonine protein kinase